MSQDPRGLKNKAKDEEERRIHQKPNEGFISKKELRPFKGWRDCFRPKACPLVALFRDRREARGVGTISRPLQVAHSAPRRETLWGFQRLLGVTVVDVAYGHVLRPLAALARRLGRPRRFQDDSQCQMEAFCGNPAPLQNTRLFGSSSKVVGASPWLPVGCDFRSTYPTQPEMVANERYQLFASCMLRPVGPRALPCKTFRVEDNLDYRCKKRERAKSTVAEIQPSGLPVALQPDSCRGATCGVQLLAGIQEPA